MTTIRDFIRHPVWASDPQSIPAGIPIGRNEAQGAHDFPHMPVLPPPTAFFVKPNLKGLPPFSALWSQPRTWLRNR